MYAIVRSGSKQQKVAVGDVIEIDAMAAAGDTLTLPVVMVVDGEKVTATGLDKASVTVEVTGRTKGPKIIIQKYKNKTGYKKRQGHRQNFGEVRPRGGRAGVGVSHTEGQDYGIEWRAGKTTSGRPSPPWVSACASPSS